MLIYACEGCERYIYLFIHLSIAKKYNDEWKLGDSEKGRNFSETGARLRKLLDVVYYGMNRDAPLVSFYLSSYEARFVALVVSTARY